MVESFTILIIICVFFLLVCFMATLWLRARGRNI